MSADYEAIRCELHDIHKKLNAVLGLVEYSIAKDVEMAAVLDALQAQVTRNNDVIASAVLLINGLADRIASAVAAAIANGATAAELAPVQAEIDAMKAKDDELAASIAANTPAAP